MRVLVCGGRNYRDRESVFHQLHSLAERCGYLTVIEGGATGADALAREWASSLKHDLWTFQARWSETGRPGAVVRYRRDGTPYDAAAGGIRNQRMLDEGKPDLVIAFTGGRGTADMVNKAHAAGLPVEVYA